MRLRVRSSWLTVGLMSFGLALAGCGGGTTPEVPAAADDGSVDAQLVEGRELFIGSCARCHGADGGGGAGPNLSAGRSAEAFPAIADQIAVVRSGRDAMPAFGEKLSEEGLEAVVRFVREVL